LPKSSDPVVPRHCLLGIGSNLGNRLANLQDALLRLERAVSNVRVSALYESDPVGPPGQPPYLNAVAAGDTILDPSDLLVALKRIEWALGRRPAQRWSARPVDLDILIIEGVSLHEATLTIPHPRITERLFVLLPLADLAPNLRLATGRAVTEEIGRLQAGSVRRIAGDDWRDAVSVFPPTMPPPAPQP